MRSIQKPTAVVGILLLLSSTLMMGCGRDSNPTAPASTNASDVENTQSVQMTIVDLAPNRRRAKLVADVKVGEQSATMVAEVHTSPKPDGSWETQVRIDDELVSVYSTDLNELGDAAVGDGFSTPQGLPAAIIVAVATKSLISGVVNLIWYTITNFTDWDFNEAVDTTAIGMATGAAFGGVGAKFGKVIKPVANKIVIEIGKGLSLKPALEKAKLYFNEVVEAVKQSLR